MYGAIKSEFAVVWTNDGELITGPKGELSFAGPKEVRVEDTEGMQTWSHQSDRDGTRWADPIGRSHIQWRKMNENHRALLMLETALDLAMQGYDLKAIVREFAKVDCFYALGRVSCPMCRLLTSALLGKCLEPNTMTFDELMTAYAPEEPSYV